LYFFGFNDAADIELDDDNTSANYASGALILTNLKFNSTAWSLTDGEPDGGTTTWALVTDVFEDKAPAGDKGAAEIKFAANGNALVTAKTGGADKSEFAGWSLADAKGLLSDF
jgi:hypothetical protein